MKIKLNKLVNNIQALKELAQCKELPATVSFKLAKNMSNIQLELDAYGKAKNDLIAKYGTENEIKLGNENWTIFQEEHKKLLDIDLELDINRIGIELVLKDDIRLSPGVFIGLDFMFIS